MVPGAHQEGMGTFASEARRANEVAGYPLIFLFFSYFRDLHSTSVEGFGVVPIPDVPLLLPFLSLYFSFILTDNRFKEGRCRSHMLVAPLPVAHVVKR